MTVDIYNRVNVNFSIGVPPQEDLSVHNTAMVTDKALPASALYKLYQSVDDFIVDFPNSTAPEEYTWGTAFFSENSNGNLFVIHTELPTSDTSTDISTAILNALNEIEESALSGQPSSFYTVSISNGDDIFYSDEQVVAEIKALEGSGKELFFIAQSYSTTMFNDLNNFPPAAYLQSTELKSLGVLMIGYPNVTTLLPVPKVSAGVAGFLSQVSTDNGAQQDLDGQSFPDITPLQTGTTDTYGTKFSRSTVNTLVNAQVNMYTRFKNQTQFALGFIMAPENIPALYYYIRQLLKEELQETLNPLFYSGDLPYAQETITRVRGIISTDLDKFVKAKMINSDFIIVDPVLDYTQPIPRTLSWQIQGTLQGRLYAINIGGTLQG
jgi:hypothetical protein